MAQLKYGWLRGGKVSVPLTAATSEVPQHLSGKFVRYNTATGLIEIAQAAEEIIGWAEAPEETTPAGTVYNVIIDPSAIFRLPIHNGTLDAGNRFDKADILMSGTIQGVDVEAGVSGYLIIIDGDYDNSSYVDVMLNPVTHLQTAAS